MEAGRSGDEENGHMRAGPLVVEVGMQRGAKTRGICRR